MTRINTKIREEGGQAIVILALAMTVMLGMAAVAIDLASWYQQRHQDQVAADGAALAAANCMAYAGISTNQCTSTTDTTNAAAVATTYAADNNVAIPASDVSFNLNNGTVTVQAPKTAPAFFAGLLGMNSGPTKASSIASWTPPTSNACTSGAQSSGECYFIFAKDTTCSDYGASVTTGGNGSINGAIHSNSSFLDNGNGHSSFGPTTYGNGSGCTSNVGGGPNHPSFSSGPTAEAAIATWPFDYSLDYPACPGTSPVFGTVTCTGPGGTPSYCTLGGVSFTLGDPVSGNLYCAYGTGTPSNPATWTGVIAISPGAANSYSDTFVGGTVTFSSSGNQTLQPYDYPTNNLLFYATSSGAAALSFNSQGGLTLTGDFFAPNGTATVIKGGNANYTTMIEAQDVSLTSSGTITGDGPNAMGSATSTPGTDGLSG